MAVKSGWFNAIRTVDPETEEVSFDRVYDNETMNNFFKGLISPNGIFSNVGDKLQVSAAEGMTITVGIGKALAGSHWIDNTALEPLTVEAADVARPRWDAVMARFDGSVSVRTGSLYIKKGVPMAEPVKPSAEGNYGNGSFDATVSYPGVDYRFINDSDYSIGIRANYEKGKVKVEIFAVPILERGEVQYLQSKKIEEFDEPPISIIESGEASRGTKGSEWQVFKVIEKPGEAQQKIPNHYARYQGHTPTAYESNTYKDKDGVLRTRAFRTGGSSRSGSSNQNGNRSTNRTIAPTTTQAVPLPAEDGSDVIVPFNINTPM